MANGAFPCPERPNIATRPTGRYDCNGSAMALQRLLGRWCFVVPDNIKNLRFGAI